MISSAISATTTGIYTNMQRMNAAAESIADAETPSIESVMNLKMAEHAIKTNAAAAAVVYETTDYLLDIMV